MYFLVEGMVPSTLPVNVENLPTTSKPTHPKSPLAQSFNARSTPILASDPVKIFVVIFPTFSDFSAPPQTVAFPPLRMSIQTFGI